MNVAVASEDGVVVNQHFGRATQFLIYAVEEEGCRLIDIRKNQPPCGTVTGDEEIGHAEEPLQRTVALLTDCSAVVVARIGQGAVQQLSNQGIQTFVIPDFIDSALRRLKASGRLAELVVPGEDQFKWLKS
jgi:predicted Fe-Mo cluster-binding NifX family protein